MTTWKEFTEGASRIAAVFTRRHRATGNLCMLAAETGFDQRGREFDHFYAADLSGGSAVEVGSGHLDVTVWKPGEAEWLVRKH